MTRQIVSRVGNYVICQGMAADAGLWFTQRGKEVQEFFSREEAEKFAGAQDAEGYVIKREGSYQLVEGRGRDAGTYYVRGNGEEEEFETRAAAEKFMSSRVASER